MGRVCHCCLLLAGCPAVCVRRRESLVVRCCALIPKSHTKPTSNLPPQFGKQEPGTNEEIVEFATKKGASGDGVDIFSKVEVKGAEAHEVRQLTLRPVSPRPLISTALPHRNPLALAHLAVSVPVRFRTRFWCHQVEL